MKKFLLFILALVLVLDISTKYLVQHFLPLIQFHLGYPFGGIGILHTSLLKISLVHTTNTGTAWGLFSNYSHMLLLLRLAITGCLLVYLFFFKPKLSLQIPLTLICAGAIGNILDTFLYGHVIDMFYLIFYRYSYPVFNVADSAIFCSVIYLAINSYRKKEGKVHASSR